MLVKEPLLVSAEAGGGGRDGPAEAAALAAVAAAAGKQVLTRHCLSIACPFCCGPSFG